MNPSLRSFLIGVCLVGLLPGWRLLRAVNRGQRIADVDARTAHVATAFLAGLCVGLVVL